MSRPVRLEKKEHLSFNEQLESWLMQHAHIILPLLLIVMLLLIGAVIGIMVSGGNMTMTESNQYYYHLDDIVKCISWRS